MSRRQRRRSRSNNKAAAVQRGYGLAAGSDGPFFIFLFFASPPLPVCIYVRKLLVCRTIVWDCVVGALFLREVSVLTQRRR